MRFPVIFTGIVVSGTFHDHAAILAMKNSVNSMYAITSHLSPNIHKVDQVRAPVVLDIIAKMPTIEAPMRISLHSLSSFGTIRAMKYNR